MNAQTIFIIDKKNNVLIFLGILDKTISINKEELAKILGTIVSQTTSMQLNSIAKAKIDDKSYIFGNFEKIIIIIKMENDAITPKEFLNELNKTFITNYLNILENYTETDIPKFKVFLEDIKKILPKYLPPTPDDKKIEVEIKKVELKKAEPKKAEPKKIEPIPEPIPEPITIDQLGTKPLIEPMKRDAYPEGIPEYKRDEVLWNETQMVKDEYVAEFVEGMISNLQIFLSISLTHHYEVFIDFSNYPLKPTITFGEGLKKELGKSIEELVFFFKKWDTKVPPHIIEIVREFEAVLMKYKAAGKLSDTAEMPEAVLPELEPLPELPPLEEASIEEDTSTSKDSQEEDEKESQK